MEYTLFLPLLLFCTLCAAYIIHKYANSKIKIIAYFLLIFSIFYFFYMPSHSPDKNLYNAAFKYFICEKNQLYENECNTLYSKLEASKLTDEIAGLSTIILDKTIRLAEFEANPGKVESPYSKITMSLQKMTYFYKAHTR